MTNKQTIKKILAMGYKEYIPNIVITSAGRAWQKRLRKDISININFYEMSKIREEMKDYFEIEIYYNRYEDEQGAEQIKIYAFNDFIKEHKRALEYVAFLKGNYKLK